jgi:uncharacterized membrane protein
VVLNSKTKKDLRNHIALGVLQIIFGDIIAGILMLIKNATCRKVGFVSLTIILLFYILIAVLFALSEFRCMEFSV